MQVKNSKEKNEFLNKTPEMDLTFPFLNTVLETSRAIASRKT